MCLIFLKKNEIFKTQIYRVIKYSKNRSQILHTIPTDKLGVKNEQMQSTN